MKHSTIQLLAMLLLSVSSLAQTKLQLRTDGYYFYDNESDSIVLISTETVTAKDIYDLMKDVDQKSNPFTHPLTCTPNFALPTGNSSFLHFISFFSQDSGTAFSEVCPDIATYKNAVSVLSHRKNGTDTSNMRDMQTLYGIKIDPGNSLHFYFSKSTYYKEEYQGTLYPDKLVLEVKRSSAPDLPRKHPYVNKRTYKFYRFDQLPPSRNVRITYVKEAR